MEETVIDNVEIVQWHSATRFMDIVWMDVPLALRFQDAKVHALLYCSIAFIFILTLNTLILLKKKIKQLVAYE